MTSTRLTLRGVARAALVLWSGIALSGVLAHAAPKAAGTSVPSPLARIAVINACGTADVAEQVAGDLKASGFNVVKVGKVPASTEITRIVYQPTAERIALEVSKKTLGALKLVKATSPVPGADILLTVGCATAKAMREAQANLLKATRVAVINACGTADASAQVAGDLKASGFNVVKVGKVPTSTEITRIIYQPASEKVAQEVSQKTAGSPKLVKAPSPVPGADVLLTLGCGTAKVVLAQKRPGGASLPTVASGAPSRAIFPSPIGGSGLLASHTAEVIPVGSFGASGFVNSSFHLLPDEYKTAGITTGGANGLPPQDVDLLMSFNAGVAKRVEAGVVFPVALASGFNSGFGLKNIRATGRVSLYDNPRTPTKVAATAFVGIPSSTKDQGSANLSGGIEANGSYFFGEGRRFSINGNLGYEVSDYVSKAFPGSGYQNVGKLDVSGSFTYLAIEKLLVSAELVAQSVLNKGGSGETIPLGDEDLFAVLGVRILPTRNIAVGVGGGFGIPFSALLDDTNYLIVAGASYLFGSVSRTAVAIPEAPAAPAAARPQPQAQKEAFLAPPPKPLAPPPAPAAPAIQKKSLKDMRVEVKDACGRPGVRDYVGKVLITKGFNVVKIGESPQKGAAVTEILYAAGYEPEAQALRKNLKGAPKLTARPSGTEEITVLAGCDQAQ